MLTIPEQHGSNMVSLRVSYLFVQQDQTTIAMDPNPAPPSQAIQKPTSVLLKESDGHPLVRHLRIAGSSLLGVTGFFVPDNTIITTGGKTMDENSRTILTAPFRKNQIKQRPGSFGATLSYVEGSAVIERLNQAFNHSWNFEILTVEINAEAGDVLAHVRIVAEGIIKEGYGSSQITHNRDSGEMVDLGSNIKAACTDGLKKAATLFGVGLNLYQTEADEPSLPQARTQPSEPPAANQQPAPPRHQSSQSSSTPTTTDGTDNRLTAKQKSLILKLTVEAGLSHADITHHCQEVYGRTVDFLSKADASKLIENLFSGQVKAA